LILIAEIVANTDVGGPINNFFTEGKKEINTIVYFFLVPLYFRRRQKDKSVVEDSFRFSHICVRPDLDLRVRSN
jgi:hypothetical protein